MKDGPPFSKGDPPSRVDQSTLKKGGFVGIYVYPPFKKGGPPFFKGGLKGGKDGPPKKGGCSSIKYTLADIPDT